MKRTTPTPEGPQLGLPARAKLSKAAGTDGTRPLLQHAHVIDSGDKRTINVTDSYRLVQHTVPDTVPLGPINVAALKRIEAGAKYSIGDGSVEVIDKATGTKVVYPTPDVGKAPDFDALWPEEEKGETLVRIGLNAEFLKGVAEALGVGRTEGVVLDVLVKNGTTMRPMRVHPQRDVEAGQNGRAGLIMPIRVVKR